MARRVKQITNTPTKNTKPYQKHQNHSPQHQDPTKTKSMNSPLNTAPRQTNHQNHSPRHQTPLKSTKTISKRLKTTDRITKLHLRITLHPIPHQRVPTTGGVAPPCGLWWETRGGASGQKLGKPIKQNRCPPVECGTKWAPKNGCQKWGTKRRGQQKGPPKIGQQSGNKNTKAGPPPVEMWKKTKCLQNWFHSTKNPTKTSRTAQSLRDWTNPVPNTPKKN